MRDRRTASLAALAVLVVLLAACVPTTLARFVDSPAVGANAFQTRSTFGGSHLTTGSYVGNGVDGRVVAGLGFSPVLVIVKSAGTQIAVARSSTMAGDASKPMTGDTALQANRIQSLDADGFTLGTDASVNGSGGTYSWAAFRAQPGVMTVGSYTGNGFIQGVNTGLDPDHVIVMGTGATSAVQRSTGLAGTFGFDESTTNLAITGLTGTGFTVLFSGDVNSNGVVYHYVAWRATAGSVALGTYAGNNTDNRAVNVGFEPEFLLVRNTGNGNACDRALQRTGDLAGDQSLPFIGAAVTANAVQAFSTTGFQLGTDCRVNASGDNYAWTAFRDY
jgi:hypothetical protein